MSYRKDFKRKAVSFIMTMALCLGAFVMVPISAKAAEQADYIGMWECQMGRFDIRPDGQIYHYYTDGGSDYEAYTYYEQKQQHTVYTGGQAIPLDYQLIKGDLNNNTYATLFYIYDNGNMVAFNIAYDQNSSEWKLVTGQQMTPVNTDKEETKDTPAGKQEMKAASAAKESAHTHNFEWVVTIDPTETADGESAYKCSCGQIEARQPISADHVIRRKLLDDIRKADAGSTITFDKWLCYPQSVLDALKEKGDVSLKTDFTYKGIQYSFTIPAGSDYSNLEPADFYGYMYLLGAFDGTVVE